MYLGVWEDQDHIVLVESKGIPLAMFILCIAAKEIYIPIYVS